MKLKTAQKLKRTVSFAAAMAMTVSAFPAMPVYAETGTRSYVYDNYRVDYTVGSEWFGKQNVSVTLTNTSDKPILNWALGYDAEGDIDGIWNGYISSQNGEDYIIKNMGYNYEILPNQSVTY